jgi:hypothetical protein
VFWITILGLCLKRSPVRLVDIRLLDNLR